MEQVGLFVYARCFETLPKAGMLVNGDFIKPAGTTWEHEPGRFEIERHFELLCKAGFADPKSVAEFEVNIEFADGRTKLCVPRGSPVDVRYSPRG